MDMMPSLVSWIEEFPGCYKLNLTCPKCGKKGVAFISKTSETNVLRVYHRDDSCLMMRGSVKWGEEIERLISFLGV